MNLSEPILLIKGTLRLHNELPFQVLGFKLVIVLPPYVGVDNKIPY